MMTPDLSEFAYDHLPQHLREASRPFAEIADDLIRENEPGPQRNMAMHYLLLAKDAAVRARKNSLRVYDVGTIEHMAICIATSHRDAIRQTADALASLMRPREVKLGDLEKVVSFTTLSDEEQLRNVHVAVLDGHGGDTGERRPTSIRELVRENGLRPGVLWYGKRTWTP